jgi:cytochrome c-type biogenesis protein CcmH
LRILVLLFALFSVYPTFSGTLAEYKFDNPDQSQDFRSLIEKMRCLVCQNESLAGSDAELAHDLRNEIYDMVKAGKSHDQVIEFMVARYGDFVLYDPPIKPSTYPLWFGPLILFLIGAVLLARAVRRKKQSQETTLTTDEEQRLASLIKPAPDASDTKK